MTFDLTTYALSLIAAVSAAAVFASITSRWL